MVRPLQLRRIIPKTYKTLQKNFSKKSASNLIFKPERISKMELLRTNFNEVRNKVWRLPCSEAWNKAQLTIEATDWYLMRSIIWYPVCDQVWDNIGTQIRRQVWSQIREEL